MIVRTGIYYAAALAAAGALIGWLLGAFFAAQLSFRALFSLYFSRAPDRKTPAGPVAVSPADGKVVAVKPETPTLNRISIFLNVFDVHVNRTPIGGGIRPEQKQKGRF